MKVVCRPRIYNAHLAHTLRTATVRETPVGWHGTFAAPIRHAQDELQRVDIELRAKLHRWLGYAVFGVVCFGIGYLVAVLS